MSDQIKTQGTIVIGPYKGYVGRADYDPGTGAFYGEVCGTRDVITFQGEINEIAAAFAGSVDDYLSFCEARGEPPEKPVSGRFVVRLPTALHRKLVNIANAQGTSLNRLIADMLTATTSQYESDPG